MKKIAVRGLVILGVVLICSAFFASTIRTITAPKVKFAPVGYKRFEEQITMQGELYFAETDAVTLEEAAAAPVTVETLFVSAGDLVAEGDTIAETKLADTFNDEVEAARQALVDARDAYMQNEVANIKLIDNIDSDKNEAYRLLNETSEAQAQAQAALLAAAAKLGIALPEDTTKWATQVQLSGDEELIGLMEDVLDKSLAATEASDAFLETYATSDTKTALYEFLLKRGELQTEVDRAQQDLIDLVASGEGLTTIRAEHEGYLTELYLEKGRVYDGSSPAYEITAADQPPILRVDVTGNDREFTEGMRVDIPTEYNDLRAEVARIAREGVDRKYLEIDLDDETISALGGIRSLLNNTTPVSLTYRGKTNSTILPASAVRNNGEEEYYVYVAEYDYSGFMGGEDILARETPVTVIDLGDKEVSIQEDLRNERVLYQEDRPLSDGARVMEYID